MKYILQQILLIMALSCLVFSQTQNWKDINGSPNFSLLRESENGTVFASYGTQVSSDPTLGLYRSTDAGLSWSKTPINSYIDELVGNGRTVLVTRPDSRGNYSRNVSTDNGTTWIPMNASTTNFLIYFFISDTGGIYSLAFNNRLQIVTYEIGSSRWRTFGNDPMIPNNYINNFMMDHSSKMYIGTYGYGVYSSTDRGTTWMSQLPNRQVGAMLTTSRNAIVLGTNPHDSIVGGVYRSLDTGKTWTSLGLVLKTIGSLIEDSSGHIYANTSTGIYRYDESRRVWDNIGPKNIMFDNILVTKSNVMLATSSTEGVYRSTDFGVTWLKATTTTGKNVTALCIDNAHITYAGTLGDRIFRSANVGSGWYQTPTGAVGGEVNAFTTSDTVVYTGTDEGLFRTTNHGVSWENLTSNIFGGAVYDVAINNTTGDIFTATNFGVYRSTDRGENWVSAGLAIYGITKICITPQHTIFANTSNSGMYRSTDNGVTWSFSGLSNSGIISLSVDFNGTIFAGGFANVYRSTDNGTTWVGRACGTDQVFCLITRGYHVFAGTSNGVYHSLNNGLSWSLMSTTGLKSTIILSLMFDNSSNLIVGTYQGGVYQSIQTVTDVRPSFDVPTQTQLMQNYPNPFNPTTNLSFIIGHSSLVTLKVYNLLGQEVATLINEVKEPGEYNAQWDANGFSSGVYFYRLQTDAFSEIKKMVLVR